MKTCIFSAVIVLFGLCVFAGVSLADAETTATRTVPAFVDPDTGFEVVITVDNPPGSYVLYERIPHGFVLGSADPEYISYNEDDGTIIWVVAGEGSLTYTYSLVGHEPGKSVFNGNLVVTDEYSVSLEGDIEVIVRDNCTENWVCGYWSECIDGLQTKTCRDENDCMFPEHEPRMERTCTVDEDAVDEEEIVPADDAPPPAEEEEHVAETEDDIIAQEDEIFPVDDEDESGHVAETEDDITAQEDESGHVEDELITGHATAIEDTQIEDSPAGNVGVGIDEPGNLDDSEDIAKVPLFTKVLGFILVVEIMLLIIIRK